MLRGERSQSVKIVTNWGDLFEILIKENSIQMK